MATKSLEPLPTIHSAPAVRRVVVVDDHAYVRRGLRRLIDAEPDLAVVGDAADAEQAMELIERLRPDLAVVDLRLPGMNGIELARRLSAVDDAPRVLIVSMQEKSIYEQRVREAGASGFVSKHERPATIIHAIRAVLSGGEYFAE